MGTHMFSSKTPRDLNRDPMPWVWTIGYWRRSTVRSNYRVSDARFEPRPKYDHAQLNEPNPVLVAFRDVLPKATPAQIDQALKVLSRLAAHNAK